MTRQAAGSIAIRAALAVLLAAALALTAFALLPAPPPAHDPAAVAVVRQRFLKEKTPLVRHELRGAVGIGELSDRGRLLPQTSRYATAEVAALFSYARGCEGTVPDPAPEALAKAWTWHRHLCRGETLPTDFFDKGPLIHPGGGSFVARAASSGEGAFGTAWLAAHADKVHLGEWRHLAASFKVPPAYEVFARLGPKNAERAARGDGFVRVGNNVLLRAPVVTDAPTAPIYLEFSGADWDAANEGTAFGRFFRTFLAALGFVLAVTAALFLAQRLLRRAREAKERDLLVQTLAHELRTPLTGFKLALEPLRKRFDSLAPELQESILVISSGTERLTRLVETTQRHLKAFSDKGRIEPLPAAVRPALHDFVAGAAEEGGATVELLAADRALAVDPFWLGLCLKNLLENARMHGKPPVVVRVTDAGKRLKIDVVDAGVLTATPKELARWTQPFVKGSSSRGLGLGLHLVRSVMRRLGGKLEITREPATFSLIFRRGDR